ncbi:MAG: TonB-dependent receptor [Proteobacteria bacterium]|nr:TonB-dependent receptor [Pseudomonadota bacterium]
MALALGLSAAFATAIVDDAFSQAQDGGNQTAQASRTATFDIPAQPLASALTAFGRQASLQVIVDPAIVEGRTGTGVSGTLTAEQALGRILAGTGISYRFTSPYSVTIAASGQSGAPSGAMQLDPVRVQGVLAAPTQAMIGNLPPAYAGGQVASGGQVGFLGNRDVMDTPFNQTSYTAQKVQDQQARTVKDAMIDNPGVRGMWSSSSGADDSLKIRGFKVASQDISYGGLFGVLPVYLIAAELPERIEVLNGPSAMLNGIPPGGSIGGSINLVPKRAPNQPLTEVTASYASAGQVGGAVDIGRRFGADKQFGVRFNGVFRAGNTAVDRNAEQLGLALLGLDFRGERVRISGDFGYQYQQVTGLTGMPVMTAGVAVPSAPPAASNFGQPWGFVERRDMFGTIRAEIDVTDNITGYFAYGMLDNRTHLLSGGYPTIVNQNGNFASRPFNESDYYNYRSAEVGVRASATTGPIGHEFSLNGTNFQREFGAVANSGLPFNSNLFNPTFTAPPNLSTPVATKTAAGTLSSIGLADTLSAFDKRIQLTLGARLQRVTADSFNAVSGAPTSTLDQNALSPSVALVVKPWRNVSIYGNFIQGLQQGTIVTAGFANAGAILPPFKSTQFEVGVKVDWGTLTTTLSAFQITQPSNITDVASNTVVQNGEQRNRGLEFNVFGEIAKGVRVLGGASLMDAVLTKTAGGLTDGWQAAGAPAFQANISGEWDPSFARGLTLASRLVYTGSQYIDTTFPRRSIPDWARVDVGARYTFDHLKDVTEKPVTIRFSVENVFDTNYWAGTSIGYLVQGGPRTFRLSSTMSF